MIKLMRLCFGLSIVAALICVAGSAIAGDGPGKGYARVSQGAYSVVAEVRAKPGKEAELRAATLPRVALVRSDPKNLVYFLQEDREAPGHFKGKPGSIPHFRRDGPAPIPLRIIEGDPKICWESEVSEELATPFEPSRAPLIRAVLIQGNRDTAFSLVAHHSIADGLSLAYAIRDTVSAVSGGFLATLPSLPSQEEMLAARAPRVRLASASNRADGAPAGSPGTYRPLDHARPMVKGLHLEPALTTRIRDRARLEGTTVHGALSAAIVIAGRETCVEWNKIPLRVMSPINIRPLLGVGENCGVFISAATGVFERKATSFWELAREAKSAIAAGQTHDGVSRVLSALGEVVGKGAEISTAAEFAAVAFAHEAMLTNIGMLPFDSRFGPLKLEGLFGPAALAGMEGQQTIGVATVAGSICLTHTSHAPLAGLLEATQRVLVTASQ